MITLFENQFIPKRQAVNAPQSIAPMLSSPELMYDRDAMNSAQKQVDHYKGWNYIAISRNAMKVSQYFPNVSTVTGQGSGSFGRQSQHLTKSQLQHLRQFYQRPLRQGFEDLEPLDASHPLVDLLNRVNSTDWWETFCFESLVMYQITGAMYWWLIPNSLRGSDIPAELWLIPTQWIRPKYNRDGRQVAWEFFPENDERRKRNIPLDQIRFMQNKNPNSKRKPFSALTAGAPWIMNSQTIEESRNRTFKFGVLPPLAFEYDPQKYPEPPEPELMERIERKFMAQYSGYENIGTIASIPPGINIKELGHKPSEMDFLQSAEQSRDSVLALHGTPKMAAGLSEDYNRASIFGANLSWCQNTIMPLHSMLAGFITEQLAPLFGSNLIVWFDDCSPHDEEMELQQQKADFEMGALSPAQRANYRNLKEPESDASKKTFLKMGLTPLESFSDEPVANEPSNPQTPNMGENGDNEPSNPQTPNMGENGDDDGDDIPDPDDGSDPNRDGFNPAGGSRYSVQDNPAIDVCPRCHRMRNRLGRPILLSVRQRRIVKSFEQLHKSFERACLDDLKRFWNRIKSQATANAKSVGKVEWMTPEKVLPSRSFGRQFNQTMTRHWLAQLRGGVIFESQMLGIDLNEENDNQRQSAPPSIDVDLPDEVVAEIDRHLAERQVGVWSDVYSTTQTALAEAISEGIQAGIGIDDIADRIADAIETRGNQAITIARTEATDSLNAGQQLLRNNWNIPMKEWIATADGVTRATHLAAGGGEPIPNKEPFVVGGANLMHPGDSSLGAPAAETVNCRCTSAGYVE